MSTPPKILAFAGSLRAGSFNKKLVRVAARGAEEAGATVTVLDLADHRLPIFDEDLEKAEGAPAAAVRLKEIFAAHRGLLIASPEYNSSLSAALKNVIDWVSRPAPGEAPLGCFDGRIAGLMAASPGGLGGLRGLVHLRAILQNIKVTVVPAQFALASAHEAFDDDGALESERQDATVRAIGADVARMVARLAD